MTETVATFRMAQTGKVKCPCGQSFPDDAARAKHHRDMHVIRCHICGGANGRHSSGCSA